MIQILKPMLAAKFDLDDEALFHAQLKKINYPIIASPKVDGIRCIIHPELGPVTRRLKPIKNLFTREYLTKGVNDFTYIDGELVVGEPNPQFDGDDVFNRTTRGISTEAGQPDFTFWAFDNFNSWYQCYSNRLNSLEHQVNAAAATMKRVRVLPYRVIENQDEMFAYEEECLALRYEGIMLRDPEFGYKHGRSTLREFGLIKLKRFEDAEAYIIGFEEQMHNANEAKVSEIGRTKRSSHKANLIPKNTLGALICEMDHRDPDCPFPGISFNVGTGFDDALRKEIWTNRGKYIGKVITFKYQKCGSIDRPRMPTFKGFRED